MAYRTITSRHNELIKFLARLKQRKERECYGKFLVEGAFELRRVVHAGVFPEKLFLCETMTPPGEQSTTSLADAIASENTEIFSLSDSAYQKIAYRENPDGCMGLFSQWALELSGLRLSDNPFLMVAESIEKPGNLGSLIRIADAAGVDGLILCDPVADLFNPNVIRASRGLIASVPVAQASAPETMEYLKKHQIVPLLFHPEATQALWEQPWKRPLALVLGSEAIGLSEHWTQHPEAIACKLPMHGIGDSLNVSVTAGIATYEALRHRQSK